MKTKLLLLMALANLALLTLRLPAQVSLQKPALVKDINSQGYYYGLRTSIPVKNSLVFVMYGREQAHEVWGSDGTIAGTRLLRRFSQRDEPAYWDGDGPRLFVVGEIACFTSPRGPGGKVQLWKTDGTVAGTELLKDVDWPNSAPLPMHGGVYFTSHNALWKTDGTVAGTLRLKEFPLAASPGLLREAGGTLFLTTVNALWKSDGTEEGTVQVKALDGPIGGSHGRADPQGNLLFVELYDQHGPDSGKGVLWRSDGTESGTFPLRSFDVALNPYRGPDSFLQFNGTVLFEAPSAPGRTGLWRTDGTPAGTRLLKDFKPAYNGSLLASEWTRAEIKGIFYFEANDGVHGWELWKSDGTIAGTVLVKDIHSGTTGSVFPLSSYQDFSFTKDGTLLLLAQDAAAAKYVLWRTDGTETGTIRLLSDINWGQAVRTDNGTLFMANRPEGIELWKTDGTEAGTVPLKRLTTGPDRNWSFDGIKAGSNVFFSTGQGDLWNTDGTAEGTRRVKEAEPPEESAGASLGSFVVLNDQLYFLANAETERALWRTDGTEAGTTRLKQVNTGREASSLMVIGARLYWLEIDAKHQELWRSDGTANGTVLVKSLPGNEGETSSFTSVGNTLFFTANGTNGNTRSLWRSDGTEAGTRPIKDFAAWGTGFNSPNSFTAVKETLFFTAFDSASGWELWKSDGTEAGTARVKAIPDEMDPYLSRLIPLNGAFLFTARDTDGSGGTTLWRSDGTETGTVRVTDISVDLEAFWKALTGNDAVYVMARGETGSSSVDSGLWKTDGTTDGTHLVKIGDDFHPLAEMDGMLYFLGPASSVLWKTDGTEAGTVRIKQGLFSWEVHELRLSIVIGRTLFFTLGNPEKFRNSQLWKSDGTDGGTVPFEGLNLGDDTSWPPTTLANLNGTLFFAAADGIHGFELWKLGDHDADGDGLPDWWEDKYFSGAAKPDDDPNGDGANNGQEASAGTDPKAAADVFRFTKIETLAPGIARLEWAGAPNQVYELLRSPVLSTNQADYEVIRSRLLATPPLNAYTDANEDGPAPYFYRLQLKE